MANNFSPDEYKFHYNKGKRLFKNGDIENSIKELKIAYKCNPSEDLQIKINKIEALIDNQQTGSLDFKPDKDKILINEKYYLNTKLFGKLYEYQQEGVVWLFNLFEKKKGCILADDMGLGKTIQIIFYLRELFESDMIKSALIILPKSLLVNWEREIQTWAPKLKVLTFFGNEKENKSRNLQKIQYKGGVLMTTYGTVMHNWDDLNSDENFKWDILLLDEGHKIKNPSSKTFKTVNALRANLRIVMTGTAVQNNLKELWALFDFIHQGSLLGTYPTFTRGYEKPISDSRKKDASKEEKIYGDKISKSLKNLIKPYFLRRTKEQVINQINATSGKLSAKTDFAVWIPMTNVQIDFYKKFLEQEEVKILLLRTEKRSPLLELNVLKKICDHPRLLSPEQCQTLGLKYAETIDNINIDDLIAESGKMTFVIQLINQLIEDDCKCLIFSQSKVILTILGRFLKSTGITFLRLDGDVSKVEERQTIVDKFNNESKVKILLLTIQVGGVGLTLTGANRVIIYDLNWNPSIDAQAVDRIYRIGQKKDVIVYRLITCGTVEEKIYRRQIFKDSLNRQTTGIKENDDNTYRYFTQSELFELFTLSNPHVSDTQIKLNEKHAHQRIHDDYLTEHSDWLKKQKIFGISDHDLLFTQRDEKINIDIEIEEKLDANMKETEKYLSKEAESKMSEEEQSLRFLMSRITINEEKAKTKDKYQNLELFIPSKNDIKRPTLNQSNKNIFQTKLEDHWTTTKQESTSETFIDLTTNIRQQSDVRESGNLFAPNNSTIINNEVNCEIKESNKQDYSKIEHGTNEETSRIVIDDSEEEYSNNESSGAKSELSQSDNNNNNEDENESNAETEEIANNSVASSSYEFEPEIEQETNKRAPRMKILDSSEENLDLKDYDECEPRIEHGEDSKLINGNSTNEYIDSVTKFESNHITPDARIDEIDSSGEHSTTSNSDESGPEMEHTTVDSDQNSSVSDSSNRNVQLNDSFDESQDLLDETI